MIRRLFSVLGRAWRGEEEDGEPDLWVCPMCQMYGCERHHVGPAASGPGVEAECPRCGAGAISLLSAEQVCRALGQLLDEAGPHDLLQVVRTFNRIEDALTEAGAPGIGPVDLMAGNLPDTVRDLVHDHQAMRAQLEAFRVNGFDLDEDGVPVYSPETLSIPIHDIIAVWIGQDEEGRCPEKRLGCWCSRRRGHPGACWLYLDDDARTALSGLDRNRRDGETLTQVAARLGHSAAWDEAREKAAVRDAKEHDERGFRIYQTLRDTKGTRIRVKRSSSAEGPRVWIFADDARYDDPAPHLSPEGAIEVADALYLFAREQGLHSGMRLEEAENGEGDRALSMLETFARRDEPLPAAVERIGVLADLADTLNIRTHKGSLWRGGEPLDALLHEHDEWADAVRAFARDDETLTEALNRHLGDPTSRNRAEGYLAILEAVAEVAPDRSCATCGGGGVSPDGETCGCVGWRPLGLDEALAILRQALDDLRDAQPWSDRIRPIANEIARRTSRLRARVAEAGKPETSRARLILEALDELEAAADCVRDGVLPPDTLVRAADALRAEEGRESGSQIEGRGRTPCEARGWDAHRSGDGTTVYVPLGPDPGHRVVATPDGIHVTGAWSLGDAERALPRVLRAAAEEVGRLRRERASLRMGEE